MRLSYGKNIMPETTSATSLASFTFPRTGKRGVPQQFPRRLYEMLDSETKLNDTSPNHHRVISWSSSGKAFRIYDTTAFANVVLPKYFRTKKFSSFQRNLNLYGFTKIRRGPDVDMYAHPSFVRDTPETLMNLRKITTSSRSKRPTDHHVSMSKVNNSRTVSPLSTPYHHVVEADTTTTLSPVPTRLSKIIVPTVPQWGNSSIKYTSVVQPTPDLGPARADRGKLDLLALALEQAH